MTRVAAVDVGTNSVRLLVADPGGDVALREVERHMRITRLGRGVDATGHLDDGALERTLATIEEYAARARQLGAQRLRVTATSAVRDASDRDRFFDGVRDRAGVEAEVLSGEEEGATAFLGATATVDAEWPVVVMDIGGGSTELILGSAEPTDPSGAQRRGGRGLDMSGAQRRGGRGLDMSGAQRRGGRALQMTSRQLGCVRLTERSLPDDPPTAQQVEAARTFVDAELEAAAALVDVGSAKTLVGVAGTVTTLGALHLGLDVYEPDRIHGTRLGVDDVSALTERLLSVPSAQRARMGAMAPGREDVIHAGAVILERTMRHFGIGEVLISESDILDGLAMGLLT